jgi:carbon starvation protein
MCLESLVAIMAIIAACTLEPGVYLGMNIASNGADSIAKAADVNQKLAAIGADKFFVNAHEMDVLAAEMKEKTLFGRTGGAATLAVGMANIFSKVTHGRWLDIWYHFAIMFEALFILTTLDAGTRVGRYLLQDVLGHLWKPLADVKSVSANVIASGLIVAGWGYFLIQGVRDPEGGVRALWPLFGIANQLLAAIALCLATTIILKMQLAPAKESRSSGKPILAVVVLLPLIWLLAVTMTAGAQKIFHPKPSIGFLAKAEQLQQQLPVLQKNLEKIQSSGATEIEIAAAEKAVKNNRREYVNQIVDTVVTAIFLLLVILIALLSLREWILLLARKKMAELRENSPVWLPDYAVVENKPLHIFGMLALGLGLLKELSGEAALERAQKAEVCACAHEKFAGDVAVVCEESDKAAREKLYLKTTEQRFTGVRRCC